MNYVPMTSRAFPYGSIKWTKTGTMAEERVCITLTFQNMEAALEPSNG